VCVLAAVIVEAGTGPAKFSLVLLLVGPSGTGRSQSGSERERSGFPGLKSI